MTPALRALALAVLLAPAASAALPRTGDFDLSWLREGHVASFVGAAWSRGPVPVFPADAWDPAGWNDWTATVTRVDAGAVTVRFDACGVEGWPVRAACVRESATYDAETRRSADGSHCAMLWLSPGDVHAPSFCLGRVEAHVFNADPALVQAASEAAGLVATFDGATGALLDVKDQREGEVATRDAR